MEKLHDWYRFAHVVVGILGLVLFWIPVFTKKGGQAHQAAGRMFVWSVAFVTVSALISCAWAFASPLTFTNQPQLPPHVVSSIRHFVSILGLLAVMSLLSALLGRHSLQAKDKGELRKPLLVGVLWLQFAVAIAALGFGGFKLVESSFAGRYWIVCVLSLLTLLDFNEQRCYLNLRPGPRPWLRKHIECMIGCGIAFHTAALITVVTRVLKLDLPGLLVFLPWVIPSLIGIPAIIWSTMHYAKKFKTGFLGPDDPKPES